MATYRFQTGVSGRGLTPLRRTLYFIRAIITAPILVLEIPAVLGNERTKRRLTVRFMNDLCNATLGRGLDIGNRFIGYLRKNQTRLFDMEQFPKELAMSTLSTDQIDCLVDELNNNGFVKIPGYISTEVTSRIRTKIEMSHGKDTAGNVYQNITDWLSKSASGRFTTVDAAVGDAIDGEELNFSTVQLIARKFLGASPLLSAPHSWTTTHRAHETDLQIEENAMAYHCDSDFFGFIKVFLLLTDVTMNNGPFTFIKGSHRGKRHVQGRVSDEMLNIQPNEEMFGTGQPGDVILAITKGSHKASPPVEGSRMMVQWLYTNGLLGSATQ